MNRRQRRLAQRKENLEFSYGTQVSRLTGRMGHEYVRYIGRSRDYPTAVRRYFETFPKR